MEIIVSFSLTVIDKKEFCTLSIQNETLKSYQASTMLTEIGENMLKSREGIVLDLSKVKFIDSLSFGAVANIINRAKETETMMKLKLSPALTPLIQQVSLDKVVEIIY